jgi:hypothetical protein
MHFRNIRIIFLAGAVAVGAVPVFSASPVFITVQKEHVFVQTGVGSAVADPTNPFQLYSQSPLAGGFTPPGGISTALSLNSSAGRYEFFTYFDNQSELDADFPDGSYTFSVSGSPAFSLELKGDLYPNMPEITNGTWNDSGDYVIDSTQDATITFNGFAAYGSAGVGSHMQITIRGYDGGTVSLIQSAVTPTNPSPFTSYSVPAGTLAPGSIYLGIVEFDAVAAVNDTAVAGQKASTDYSALTGFKIVTKGTAPTAPVITTQPTSQTAPAGSSVTFNLAFSGQAEFQWFKNGAAISNSNNPSGSGLTLLNIQPSDAGSYYAVVVASDGTYSQTNTVTLSIGSSTASAPTFASQPLSVKIASGSTIVFRAEADGSPAPTYQWFFDGNALSDGSGVTGVAGQALVINSATTANAGTYSCVASNPSGSKTSDAATLNVASTSNPGRLVNLSTRAQVGTGGNILIAGFVIGGSGTSGSESILARASGPALATFSVPGLLADPQLQLYSGSTVLQTNNGWAGSSAISSAAAAVGAFAWTTPSSHDSAIDTTLSANGYTLQVAGQSGDTGVALAEVYDTTPSASYTPATPRLINLSARVQVGTGGNILIAGFAIGGSTAKTVLVRASGPALTTFSVPGVLPDPKLQIYSGSDVVASNTGWGGNAQIAATAASVGAFPWAPSGVDSAILITLPPGAYTAQVSGASGDTGVALVEVYDVQ